MSNTLLGFGLFALVAAIVGGGLKAFGFQIGALSSTTRQVILAAVGIALITATQWTPLLSVLNVLFPAKTITETFGPTALDPVKRMVFLFPWLELDKLKLRFRPSLPDWSSFSGRKGLPGQDGLFVRICASSSNGPCPSQQVGISQPFSQELPAGSGTVSLFNFATSPKMTFTLRIKHPA